MQENKQEFNLNDLDPAPRAAISEIMARQSSERVRCAQAGIVPPAGVPVDIVVSAVKAVMAKHEGQKYPTVAVIVADADVILNSPPPANDNKGSEVVGTVIADVSEQVPANENESEKSNEELVKIAQIPAAAETAPGATETTTDVGVTSAPTTLKPNFDNFPAELTSLKNWVMWRLVQKPGKKKPTKVPYQPSGRAASTTDSSTWSTLDECCATYNRGGYDGIGFVFDGVVGDDGLCFVGIDFDDCIEAGKLLEPARARIASLKSYTEVSVSGAGIHSIVRAKPGSTVKHTSTERGHSIEIYSSGRYFTFTGVSAGTGEIRPAVVEVNALIAGVSGAKTAKTAKPNGSTDFDGLLPVGQPSKLWQNQKIEPLSAGLKDHWLDKLAPDQKDEVARHIMAGIAANTPMLELGENGGNNDSYFKLVTAIAVSGAPHAEDIFVEFASKVKGADSEEELRATFNRCKNAADGRITVGSLLHYAAKAGVDLSPQARAERGWAIKAAGASANTAIDWSKVCTDWKVTDLPADAPLTAKIMLEHVGSVRDLGADLIAHGLIHKGLTSWSDATKVLVTSMMRNGYSPEQMAEILSVDVPCNQYITKQTNTHRAIEKAINRQEAPKQVATGPCEPTIEVAPPEQRKPLLGGTYDAATALELLNSHYMIGRSLAENETLIYRITDKNRLLPIPREQFILEVENISIQPATGEPIPGHKFWRSHPKRHQRNIVFKPHGTDDPKEYNLWQGFGVARRPGRQKIERLLTHIREVICRSDQAKYDYLMRWHAWAVQHPDEKPETYIVLISRQQGAGKSLLGEVMVVLFGEHGKIIMDREQLVGRFNNEMEHVVYVLGEEILWAGDHKTTDKFKAMITASRFWVERKFGQRADIFNKLHVFLTSNHEHAVAAGVSDRRTVAFEVSEEHVGDKPYFNALFADLADGGYGEFLDLLLSMDLGDWHPRQQLKTEELARQQRASGDCIDRWAQACVYADKLLDEKHVMPLNQRFSSEQLRQSLAWYCKQQSLHPANDEVFGGACTQMFGRRQRIPAQTEGGVRPWWLRRPRRGCLAGEDRRAARYRGEVLEEGMNGSGPHTGRMVTAAAGRWLANSVTASSRWGRPKPPKLPRLRAVSL
jgi:hypothetical protein